MVIVLSFQGCLWSLRNGTVTPEELAGAWFYLGCSRTDVLGSYGLEENPDEAELVASGVLRDAVHRGEIANRVGYRKGSHFLGVPSGLQELIPEKLAQGTYPALEKHIRAVDPTARVIWR
jgi:hypothetical protein